MLRPCKHEGTYSPAATLLQVSNITVQHRGNGHLSLPFYAQQLLLAGDRLKLVMHFNFSSKQLPL
jgi:hypothetical protein